MTQQRILKALAAAFHKHRVPYMFTGSIAVSFYGHPRYTHDVDIVMDVVTGENEALRKALVSLKTTFLLFVDADHLDEAFRSSRMISLLDRKSEMKVDLWLFGNDSFSASSFSRRKSKRVFETPMNFIAPEDLIIQKLLWYKDAKSDRHLADAYSVYYGQKNRLNEKYLNTWAKKLGVTENLDRIKTMPNPQN